jgi:acetyltransferase-like isoleucine patch superfamily enzyme
MLLKKIKIFIGFTLAKLPMRRRDRWRFYKLGGVQFADNHTFVGTNVIFDRMYPENIHIGKRVHIADNVTILTHYLRTDSISLEFREGHVYIGDNCFIGIHSIISKDVKIGNNCIIGAGSVVTKDIPDGEIWAGNPARFIRKRG